MHEHSHDHDGGLANASACWKVSLWKKPDSVQSVTVRYHGVQAPKSEALAGRLSAVYGIMAAQDIIKQRQSRTAHKSQVSF